MFDDCRGDGVVLDLVDAVVFATEVLLAFKSTVGLFEAGKECRPFIGDGRFPDGLSSFVARRLTIVSFFSRSSASICLRR